MEFKIDLIEEKDDPRAITLGLSAPVSSDAVSYSILEEVVSRSYLSCKITNVQPAKRYLNSEPACMLLLCFTFHPALRRRFSCADISCYVESDDTLDPLTIVQHAPRQSYTGHSKVDKSSSQGFSMPIKGTTPFGGEFGIEFSKTATTSKTVDHYMAINGSVRGPQMCECVWTLMENTANKGGMPLEFHSAIILRSKAEFRLNIVVNAVISGGVFARRLKSKNAVGSKINPTSHVGRQIQIKESLDEIDLNSWFLEVMTATNSSIPQP